MALGPKEAKETNLLTAKEREKVDRLEVKIDEYLATYDIRDGRVNVPVGHFVGYNDKRTISEPMFVELRRRYTSAGWSEVQGEGVNRRYSSITLIKYGSWNSL